MDEILFSETIAGGRFEVVQQYHVDGDPSTGMVSQSPKIKFVRFNGRTISPIEAHRILRLHLREDVIQRFSIPSQ